MLRRVAKNDEMPPGRGNADDPSNARRLPPRPRTGRINAEVTAPSLALRGSAGAIEVSFAEGFDAEAFDRQSFALEGQEVELTLTPDQPTVLIQAAVVQPRDKVHEGQLVVAVGDVWERMFRDLQRDPRLLHQFAENSRAFEEFIAATYDEAGWDTVILTPRSRDGGRDVIVERHGVGALRFLEQTKAYKPGHLVTHDDVRAMLGVLVVDQAASKGIITTTSDFQPGVLAGKEFAPFMPTRLEVRNGEQLLEWLREIEASKRLCSVTGPPPRTTSALSSKRARRSALSYSSRG